jgi:hypothetical protein
MDLFVINKLQATSNGLNYKVRNNNNNNMEIGRESINS